MDTKDRLASAMLEVGLPAALAERAAAGEFDDFLSPHPLPALLLLDELLEIGTSAAYALRRRVMDGEFDATQEEAEAWASSADGVQEMLWLRGCGQP